MALELNGTTGVSLVQDGVVTAADLASTLDLTGKTVTLPAGVGGKVLQVVQGSAGGQISTTATSFTTSGIAASITPSSTSSKILVLVSLTNLRMAASGQGSYYTIYRDSTNLAPTGSGVSKNLGSFYQSIGGGELQMNINMSHLDSPATTSSITYTVYYCTSGNTTYINWNSQTSYIQLLEIAA